jgi:hypothetical protein
MMPHRIKLALVVIVATACASVSCLNARVRVPVKVAPADDRYNVKLLPKFALVVYRADDVCDEKGEGCKDCPVDKKECWEDQADVSHAHVPLCVPHKDKEGDTNLVARETTSLDGTASFDLLPGNYELCSEDRAQFGDRQLEWGVPFRVEGGGWEVSHRDRATHEWVYSNETGNVSEEQLVLSNDNGFWFKPDAAAEQQSPANQTAATDRAAARARPR